MVRVLKLEVDEIQNKAKISQLSSQLIEEEQENERELQDEDEELFDLHEEEIQ